jgi:O-antigen/teichoic acid export membrane protein
MTIKKRLLTGVLWSIIDKLVNHLGLMAITLYLANQLGPQAFGLIGMLAIFMLLAQSLVDSGFSQALIQRSHQATASEFNTVFITNVGLSLLIYALLFALSPWIALFYQQPELTSIARVLFVVVIIQGLAVVVRAKLVINVDFKLQAKANFIGFVISSAVAIWVLSQGGGYWALVAMEITKAICVVTSLWWFCPWRPQLQFSGDDFKSLFGFGSKLMLAGLLATAVNNLYALLIGRWFDAKQVGYYSQSAHYTNLLSNLVTAVLQGVTYPIMTEIKTEREKLVWLYQRLLSITLLVTFPVLFGFLAVAPTFTALFLGQAWLPIVPILMLLALARTITPINAINMNILNAIGRSDLFLKVDLLKIPLFLLALCAGAPFGILGVAIAAVTSSMVAFFINAYYPKQIFGFGAKAQLKLASKPLVASLLMVAVTYPIQLPSLWLTLVVQVAGGGLVYLVTLWVLKEPELMNFIVQIKGKLAWQRKKSRSV